jgi:hypothetical protein
MAERKDEKDTTREGTRAAASGRQALQEAGQQTEHAVNEGVHADSETLHEVSRIGAEVVERGFGEASQNQERIAQQMADQGQHLFREVAEAGAAYAQTAEATITELQSLVSATRAASAGFVDAQRIWAGWYSRALQFGTRLPQDLLRCRTIHDVASVQSAWAHDSLTGLIEASTEILRTTREAADRSLRPLEEWREQTGGSNGDMGGSAQETSDRHPAGRVGGHRATHAEPARTSDKPARAG